jgi:hypothetical protein
VVAYIVEDAAQLGVDGEDASADPGVEPTLAAVFDAVGAIRCRLELP